MKTEQYYSDMDILSTALELLVRDDRERVSDELLRRFGSAANVFKASDKEILTVPGISATASAQLRAAAPEFRQALKRALRGKPISGERALVLYAVASGINGQKHGTTVTVYTDGAGIPIKSETGTRPTVKHIVGEACYVDAAGVTMIQKGGDRDDRLDIHTLKYLAELMHPLQKLDIDFIDMILYKNARFLSLRRAIDGDGTFIDCERAQEKNYRKMPDFYDRVAAYAKNQGKRE